MPRTEEPVRVGPPAYGAKSGVLLLLGLGLGLALFHSRFGFTSAWRQLIAVGDGPGFLSVSPGTLAA